MYSCLIGLVAVLLVVFVEPKGIGSGIPEIRCHLNGLKIARIIRLKTMLTKSISVIFASGSGLFIGKEGPMVHAGATVGTMISRADFTICGKRIKWNIFRNDEEKRDFAITGTAAGVAAAFGAPIGGLMFVLEESSSWWN